MLLEAGAGREVNGMRFGFLQPTEGTRAKAWLLYIDNDSFEFKFTRLIWNYDWREPAVSYR